jgi:hypothetical protein
MLLPLHLNCSQSLCTVEGNVTMSTVSWSQKYDVSVTYKCGKTGVERWTAKLAMDGMVTDKSIYTPQWGECKPIYSQPMTAICR